MNDKIPSETYAAYVRAAGGKSLVSGQPLPGWGDLPEPIKQAWRIAAAWAAGCGYRAAKAGLPDLPGRDDLTAASERVLDWWFGKPGSPVRPADIDLYWLARHVRDTAPSLPPPIEEVRAELDEMGVDCDPAIARVLAAVRASRAQPASTDEQEGE